MEKYLSSINAGDDPQKVIERVLLSTKAAQIGTWDFDVSSKKLVWDDAMYRLHGIQPESFGGAYEAWLATLHPEDEARCNREIQLAIKGEKEFDTEFRVIWPDKSVHFIRAIALVQRDSTGYALRMVGTNWDITESKIAEQKLESINKELNIFLDTIDEIFFSVDMINGRVIRISNACERLHGYKSSEFYSNHLLWLDMIHPDDKHITEPEEAQLRNGKQVNNQYRIICKDGSVKWVETKIIPSLDENGVLVRVDGVTRDVTKSKLNEESLKKSEANLRTILNNTSVAYIQVDPRFIVISFNEPARQVAYQFFGKILEEGSNALDYYPEERKPFIKEVMEQLMRGEVVQYEINYLKDNKISKWYDVRYAPIAEDKKNLGYICSMTDISESKHATIEREKITNDLIQRNKDLEQFTYMVSHNLRVPVANIKGLADILQKEDVNESETEEVLKNLATSVGILDTVILDMNNTLKGKLPFQESNEI